MLDQKERFSLTGLRVEFVGSAQDNDTAIGEVISGSVQLVYISPESILTNKKFRGMWQKEIYQDKLIIIIIIIIMYRPPKEYYVHIISYIVSILHLRALCIDEAHCVKLW